MPRATRPGWCHRCDATTAKHPSHHPALDIHIHQALPFILVLISTLLRPRTPAACLGAAGCSVLVPIPPPRPHPGPPSSVCLGRSRAGAGCKSLSGNPSRWRVRVPPAPLRSAGLRAPVPGSATVGPGQSKHPGAGESPPCGPPPPPSAHARTHTCTHAAGPRCAPHAHRAGTHGLGRARAAPRAPSGMDAVWGHAAPMRSPARARVCAGADISGTHRHGASHVCRAQWILCLRGVPRLHSARHSSVARGTSLCCILRLRRACHTPAKRATSSWCTLHGCTVPHAHGASCVQELCATAPVQGAPHTLRALCITRGRHPAAGGRSRAGCHAQGLAQPQPGRPHGPMCVTGAWLLLAFQTSRQRLTGSGDV